MKKFVKAKSIEETPAAEKLMLAGSQVKMADILEFMYWKKTVFQLYNNFLIIICVILGWLGSLFKFRIRWERKERDQRQSERNVQA